MSEFCRRLKKMLDDEAKAPSDYYELADLLYKDVENKTQPLESATIDHDVLRVGIPSQEDRHHAIVKEMFARRCTR